MDGVDFVKDRICLCVDDLTCTSMREYLKRVVRAHRRGASAVFRSESADGGEFF